MRNLVGLALGLLLLAVMAMLTAGTATSQPQAKALVVLQSATPGTPQTGHVNVTGRVVAGSIKTGPGGITFGDGTVQTSAGGEAPTGSLILTDSRTAPLGYEYSGQRFPASTAEWAETTPLPVALYGHGGVFLNGYVYVMGGTTAGGTVVATVYRYSHETRTWETMAPMAAARTHAAVVVAGGRILVFGGKGSGGSFLASCEAYDPGTNTWAHLTDLPGGGRAGMVAAVLGNVVFVLGGEAQGVARTNRNDMFNFLSPGWSVGVPMTDARAYFGGGNQFGDLILVEGNDLPSSRWHQGSWQWYDDNDQNSRMASTSLGDDVVFVGGVSNNGLSHQVRAAGGHMSLAQLPQGKSDLAVVYDGSGRLFTIGGLTSAGIVSGVETLRLYDLYAHIKL